MQERSLFEITHKVLGKLGKEVTEFASVDALEYLSAINLCRIAKYSINGVPSVIARPEKLIASLRPRIAWKPAVQLKE